MIPKISEWFSIHFDEPPKNVPIAVCHRKQEWYATDYFTGKEFKDMNTGDVNRPTHWFPLPTSFPVT